MSNNLAYQDELWEELINGQFVMMSPRPAWPHVAVSGNIYNIFSNYLKGKKCVAIPDGLDLFLDEQNNYVPDMMVVCDPDKIKSDGVHGAPDLVVEVLSPSTAKNDKIVKKAVYEQHGVREYWLVSPAEKSIEQYLLKDGRFVLHDVYQVHPDFMLKRMKDSEKAAIVTEFKCSLYDDLTIQLADVFDRVN